jgi:predicted transcriptional regulator YdeE
MKIILNIAIVAFALFFLPSCGSKSKSASDTAVVAPPSPNNAPSNAGGVVSYKFPSETFEPIDVIGKIYNLPADPTVARKKIIENRASFLKSDFITQITIKEDKLYQIFYEYQPSGFKVLIGYPAEANSTIPKGCIKMSTPQGNYGIFQFPNQADSTYYQTWGIAEAASKEFRSYLGDIEIFNLDKSTSTANIAEVRVHLK